MDGDRRKEVMTTISIDTLSYGMAVRGRTIFYCARENGLKMLNLSDNSVSNIINSNWKVPFYHLEEKSILSFHIP
jgi:hypothetical protein